MNTIISIDELQQQITLQVGALKGYPTLQNMVIEVLENQLRKGDKSAVTGLRLLKKAQKDPAFIRVNADIT